MKRLLIVLGIAAAIAFPLKGETRTQDSFERQFTGTRVRLKLASGEYLVKAGRSDRIFVWWETDKPADLRKIKVYLDTGGSAAIVRTDGPMRHARMLIELPRRTDIQVRMFAGEMRIEGIEGDKDVKMTAGELKVDANASSYSHVEASVKVGELDAKPFQFSKDGFARSFQWRGSGPYKLRARLFAGELTLR